MYKYMADIKESNMPSRVPARLRGLDNDGNSISSTMQETMAAMPLATTGQNGTMSDFHARKLEGLIFTPNDKNKFVFRTNLDYTYDSYVTFKLVILYASGVIEDADCFFMSINRGSGIYFLKSGALFSTVKSFIIDNIIYFYFEFLREYGRILIYPDFGLKVFELTDMVSIPSEAIHITSIQ